MPVEINELVIKAKVSDNYNSDTPVNAENASKKKQDALKPLEKSVQELIDILKRKNER
jgi:hypothetical protein